MNQASVRHCASVWKWLLPWNSAFFSVPLRREETAESWDFTLLGSDPAATAALLWKQGQCGEAYEVWACDSAQGLSGEWNRYSLILQEISWTQRGYRVRFARPGAAAPQQGDEYVAR